MTYRSFPSNGYVAQDIKEVGMQRQMNISTTAVSIIGL
jgi:hypothetical protein